MTTYATKMSLDQFGTMDQTRGDWHFQGHHRWLGSLARTRVSLQLSAISDGHVAEHAGPGASHFRNKLVFSGWWNPLSIRWSGSILCAAPTSTNTEKSTHRYEEFFFKSADLRLSFQSLISTYPSLSLKTTTRSYLLQSPLDQHQSTLRPE